MIALQANIIMSKEKEKEKENNFSVKDITKLNKYLKKTCNYFKNNDDDEKFDLIDMSIINFLRSVNAEIIKKKENDKILEKLINIIKDRCNDSKHDRLIKDLCNYIVLKEINYEEMDTKISATTVVDFGEYFTISRYAEGWYDDPDISIYIEANKTKPIKLSYEFSEDKEFRKIIKNFNATNEEKKFAREVISDIFSESFEVWRY
jgi:hypothetical protein